MANMRGLVEQALGDDHGGHEEGED